MHRCCGAHSVKLGWLGGGIDRGDVGGYCKTNRGVFVHRITFCVCFPAPAPLFFRFFANLGECCESITPATDAPTEQILAGVYLPYLASLSRSFGRLCFWGRLFFFR